MKKKNGIAVARLIDIKRAIAEGSLSSRMALYALDSVIALLLSK